MKAQNSPDTKRSFHTLLRNLTPEEANILQSCASLFSKAERSIFAALQAGKTNIKASSQTKFGITARQYNGCASEVEGVINSNLANLQNRIDACQETIRILAKSIKQIEKSKTPYGHKLHYKKRKLAAKQEKLQRLKDDLANKRVRVAFGSKKLFRSQYYLAENGFNSKEDWNIAWQKSRDRKFFLVGSKDETGGNQSCQLVENEDQTFDLYLRIPNALITPEQPKILHLRNITFPYGYETISAAVTANLERSQTAVKDRMSQQGQALSFRFYRDDQDRWKLFVITDLPEVEQISNKQLGRLGIDLNEDHVAVTEIDRFGNFVKSQSFPLVTYGKSRHQTLALIGDVAKDIVQWAVDVQKPIVLEKLDFQQKKAQLEQSSPSRARQLSSFAYAATRRMIAGRAYHFGIQAFYVNPAFTSVIGRSKYQIQYGLTSHQAAALVIGRRSMNLSERPLKSKELQVTLDTEIHGTFALPVRKMSKHVWSWWGRLSRQFQSAVVPYLRARVLLRSADRILHPTVDAKSISCDETSSKVLGEIPKRRRQNCSDADGASCTKV